ncbi:cysteine rich repeat-containing protein [Roseiterribacter gracilis]|uniref:Cysteine rich repeat-containing protein n=1 Tax=Roseiterribacter gracilis TaxID=2812848 RepID=A0A8S8XH02_9PROT|nr:hypothetical protein TMPK1_30040 [Rhodospirillales bacterium TMPK1]
MIRLLAALLLIAGTASAAEPEIPAARQQQLRAIAEACTPDAQKFCKDVERGEGRIVKCLRDHAAELSPACKAGLVPAQPAAPKK